MGYLLLVPLLEAKQTWNALHEAPNSWAHDLDIDWSEAELVRHAHCASIWLSDAVRRRRIELGIEQGRHSVSPAAGVKASLERGPPGTPHES